MNDGPIAVVTGANKGLGFSLVRALCQKWQGNGVVYLTARDRDRGQQALRSLEAEGHQPLFHQLDLTVDASIEAMASHLRQRHGGIDLLIQNGAYAPLPDTTAKKQVRLMIETNNRGTHRILEAFRPLLRAGARVLVVASGFGTLKSLEPRLHDQFDTNRLSLRDLEKNLDDYVIAVESDRASNEGWPDWINIASKVGQVAAMRIYARELATNPSTPKGILVNAVCPGWMITDASRPYLKDLPPEVTPQLPDVAAEDVLWAGLLPAQTVEPQGKLIQFRRVLSWN
jgi:NAD(P)-dependent dehydrogenase (short-subunit alcohol dehydrogenase family)